MDQQPVLDGIEGELTQVTFSVNLDDKGQTKAISDGLSATNLEYAVYYANQGTLDENKQGVNHSSKYEPGDYIAVLSDGDAVKNGIAKIEENGDKNWKVTLTLAKNVKYDIVFWASADGAPYTFDEEHAKILVNDQYKGLANAENRDAFYGICKEYSVISSDTKVELRRPFAQINFGASDYVPYVTDLGLKMTSKIDTEAHAMVAEVRDAAGNLLYPERPAVAKCTVPNTLNVLDGSVDGSEVVNFQLTSIPYETGDEELMKATKDGKEVVYHWMGMNYILAGAESTINNIHATFQYNGQDLTFDVPNVPYKRNFKTNIVGNLFTGAAKFNVVVVPEYAGADIVVDLDELESLNPIERAIKLAVDGKLADAAVVLSDDLTIDKTVEVPAGLNLSIDLGGKRLTSTVAPAFLAKGNLTLSNGSTATVGELVRAAEGVEIALNGVKALSGDDYAAGDNCVFVPIDAKDVTVTIDKDSELKSFGAAVIQSNGNTEGLVLNVAGKITSVGEVAMYLPQVKSCVIEGTAVISGATGIEIRAGELTIKDGAQISAGNEFDAKANGNGSTVVGAAVAVSAHSTNLPINVTVEGGVFSCAYALYEVNFFEDRTAATTLAVKGGEFNAPIYSQNCKGFITAGTFAEKVEVPAEYLAEGLMVGEDGVVVEKPTPAIELALVTTDAVPAEGGKVVVKVTANVAWTLELDGETVETGEAVNEKEVEVEVAANELEEIVEHKIVLSAEGVEPKDVKFNQAAAAPAGPVVVTVAEFLAAAEDETVYQLTGVITSVANTTYGNFFIQDATGAVYIYGLCSPEGEQKYWAASGAKVSDTITIQTVRSSYGGSPQGKDAIFVELTPFVAQASEWGVVGDFTDWGKTADVVMYNTWHTADLYVAYNVEITSGAFKIRANNSWDDSKNYGLYVAGNIYADKYYEVYSDGGSNNVTPMTYGTYDVYFDLGNRRIALMTPGKEYAEAVDGGNPVVVVAGLKDHAWGVAGSFQGWNAENAAAAVVDGDWAVVENVTLANGDEFKFVADNAWALSYGTGCEVNVGQTYVNYNNGGNMKFVGEAGAYNLYFSLIDASFYMEAYVEAPAEIHEILSFVDWKFDGANSWQSNYTKRIVNFDSATVEFASANKQSSTITHCPVTKGGDVVVKMLEGKKLTSAKFNLLQWNTKTQTATLYYSTDGGNTWSAESVAKSSNFTLESSLPEGTNALKLKFSSTSNQVAIESIEIVYTE